MLKSLVIVSIAWAGAIPAHATSIAIGNASFESPATPGSFTIFPTDAPGVFGAWEKAFTGFTASYDMATFGGKPANANGNQAATIGTKDATIFQDIANYSGGGTADQYWQAGYTYTMTVAVGLRGDGTVATGKQLDLRFFYRNSDQGAANVLASTLLQVGVNTLNPTNAGLLTDYTVTHTGLAGAPEIGKPIALWFITPNTGTTGGDWTLDNVRLDFVAVPEPSGALLGGIGLLTLLRRRRAA